MAEPMDDQGDGAQLKNLPGKLTKEKKGREQVLLNAFQLSMGEKIKSVFQHEIKFQYTTDRGKLRKLHEGPRNDVANISRQLLVWELFEILLTDHPDFFGNKDELHKYVYDCGLGFYSFKQLMVKSESMSFIVSAGRLSESAHAYIGKYDGKINVELYACGEVLLDPSKAAVGDANRLAIQFLDILSNQELINRGEYLIYAQKIFKKKSLIRLNNDPRIMKEGMQKNVRYVGDSLKDAVPVLQIDPKKSAFFPKMRVDRFLAEFLGGRDALERVIFARDNLRAGAKQLKGLVVITTHMKNNRQFEVNGLTAEPADRLTFEREGQKVSVVNYFQETYHLRLRSPGLPCAIERRPKKDGKNQESWYPLEVLEIVDGQRVALDKQTPQLTEQMIRQCQTVPSEFLKQVEREKRDAGLDDRNSFFRQFGINVGSTLMRADAEVLFPPAIVYDGETEEPDQNGRMNWRMPPNRHYLIPASAPSVWVVAIIRGGVSERDCEHFVDVIVQSARKRGVDIRKPSHYDRFDSTEVGRIREKFRLYKEHNTSFFMFFTKDKLDPVHHTMKMMEAEFGIITQHVSAQTLQKALGNKGAFMVIDNILLKTNLKLGGVNHALSAARANRNMRPDVVQREWFGNSRMFIGIDLSHAAAQTLYERQTKASTTPTVVGMAYTLGEPAKMNGTYWYQDSRVAYVQELATQIIEAVTIYRASVGKFPRHIVVFRGGVSEGEYQKIVLNEQGAFIEAFNELEKTDPQFRMPYLTIVVVQRNSNYRIVPPNPNPQQRPPEQNVRPGTCVDAGIMHPTLTEFLLVAHKAIQGTAKPIRCTVIWDSVPDRMSLDELENVTHMLCFAHGIVTSPVSVPAPLYSAGDLAKRGRNTLKEFNGADNSSCSGGNDGPDVGTLSRKLKTTLRTKYWA